MERRHVPRLSRAAGEHKAFDAYMPFNGDVVLNSPAMAAMLTAFREANRT
jgi:hypothetical protein